MQSVKPVQHSHLFRLKVKLARTLEVVVQILKLDPLKTNHQVHNNKCHKGVTQTPQKEINLSHFQLLIVVSPSFVQNV